MLFNSLPFLVFLPAVYLFYWLLPFRRQNLLLLVASYFFYGWWDWRFLSLIILSSVVDFVAARQMERSSTSAARRAWLLLSLGVNLGALGVFKYLDFGIETLAEVLRLCGFRPHLETLGVILPVGISFYTFQTLSYTIDVYRRRTRATSDVIAFFGFVAFFPQLVAGPIERAASLLPQFENPRVFNRSAAVEGARQILYGLFLKVVVADNFALLVDSSYAEPRQASAVALALATYAFAFQIYGDFAGYSHIAIGVARLLGFDLMRNFAYPYFSRSLGEFWHRWHISLSTWFRDYLYIPLGGSRTSPSRRRFNVLTTFVVSGLWHGAGFTFIIWGAIHGTLVALQWWKPDTRIDSPAGTRLLPSLKDALSILLTFHVVCFAWIFFRAETLKDALVVVGKITDLGSARLNSGLPISVPALVLWLAPILLLFLLVEWLQRHREHGLAVGHLPRPLRWFAYLVFALLVVVLGRTDTVPFVYFQF